MVTGKQKLICVVGTTASGKSDFGVELAKKYGGEIVSADSRQVFRGLDLGSGKITPEEMQGVPHHLLDVRNPNEFFSMADFQAMAYEAIDDILRRGRLPLLVGGTGLYVDSVAEGYLLSGEAPDLAYRAHLEPKNRNRVMRLLERIHAGDDLTPRKEARYDVLKLGMTFPRPELCRRIDERRIRRLDAGMVEEIQRLLDNGATPEFLDGLGLEYRYVYRYVAGLLTREEMLDELSRAIKRFAKRQMIWFRRDKSILWLDMAGDPMAQACQAIDAFLA